MRLNNRQRSLFSTATRLLGGVAAVFALQLLAPAKSSAVQIFIDSAFVHQVNPQCVVQFTTAGVPRFRCPPYPDSICAAASGPKCSTNPAGACCPDACSSCGGGGTSNVGKEAGASVNPRTDGAGGVGWGNISNDPHIEFDQDASARNNCNPTLLPTGDVNTNVCNSKVFLCAAVGYGNADNGTSTQDVAIDNLSFEVFKFQDGSNPLDPGSTPPQRTFFVDSPGKLLGGCTSADVPPATGINGQPCQGPVGPFCVLWDGSINLKGEFGKTNGAYGFRALTQTNQTGASGNIQITAVRAYPSGSTRDGAIGGVNNCPNDGCLTSQKPITVDVVNIHVVRSSPTTVGQIAPVPVQPYLLSYRLSKDATMQITIEDPTNPANPLRHVLGGKASVGIARVGEGVPDGSLANGDSWNGRADNGDIMAPGVYMAHFHAEATDLYGFDPSQDVYRQIALDPLQITDIRVQPLFEGSTSLAVLSYQLSEPATTYIDIYPPGTQFCGNEPAGAGLNALNLNTDVADDPNPSDPPKALVPTLSGGCAGLTAVPPPIKPVRRLVEQKSSRIAVTSFWDGRDDAGNLLADGDYVFVIYAALPSQNGFPFNGSQADKRIWTSQAKSGFVTVSRGFVGISQVSAASAVIGSSPSVAGLSPFIFRYSLSRDAIVSMKVFDANGVNVVRTIVNNEVRPGLFGNQERWDDGLTDAGLVVDSGTYLVQLTAADPQFPAKVSTTTTMFSINLFRITDVNTVPLLSGASDILLINYQMSQSMFIGWNIYPPGTVIHNSTSSWPPCASQGPAPGACPDVTDPVGNPVLPVFQLKGLRVGRLRITDQWDGRDPSGLLVPDGNYVYYLAAQSSQTATGGQRPHFASDRIVGTLAVQRGQIIFPKFDVEPEIAQMFNSSNTVPLHPFAINYSLTRQSSVTIQILNTLTPPSVIRTIFAGQVKQNNIALSDVWDGRDDKGNFPPPGFYNVRALATDIAAQNSQLSVSTAQLTISYDPLRIYDVAVTPIRLDSPASRILYQVSEPMKVSIKIFKPGTSFDGAGNPSPPESVSLVKRIVEVKDARRQVESNWDGTDLKLSLVPDGTYKYRIVGSTDINAIDTVTGNVLNPAALAEDRTIDDIPVVRNGSDDPTGDFVNNTFTFPNPASTPQVTFQMYLPEQGKVKLKIHNIAGDLVLEKEFPEAAPSWASAPLQWVWNKTNQSGRAVARGVYFAVIHFEGTLGSKTVLQTVKTILIP